MPLLNQNPGDATAYKRTFTASPSNRRLLVHARLPSISVTVFQISNAAWSVFF